MLFIRYKSHGIFTRSVAVRTLILCLIILFLVSYFVGLPWSPAPLFQDETDGLSRALYWSSFGKTFEGVRWPVLIPWSGQFYSFPAYFYSIALWSKFFPGSVSFAELRALGALFVAATTALVYVFSRQIRISRTFSLLAALLYISSPQALLSYRIAWDPIAMPFQVLLAVVGCQLFFNLNSCHQKPRISSLSSRSYLPASALAGCLTGLLWYGYTAGRLISMLIALLFILRVSLFSSSSIEFKLKASLFYLVSYLLVIAPVGVAIASDSMALARTSQELNQFTLLGIYSSIKSLLSHIFYFDYLIFWGDPQRRHSTGFGGVIGFSGWILLVCFVFNILKNNLVDYRRAVLSRTSPILSKPMGLVIAYVVIGTFPSALSFPEIHALRSSAAFPFWAILASLVLYRVQDGVPFTSSSFRKDSLTAAVAAVGCAIFGFFTLQYMISGSSFLASAQQGATYPGISKEYFQNNSYLRFASMTDEELLHQVSSIQLPVTTDGSRLLFEYLSRRLDLNSTVRPEFFNE